jgi:hypothetical protein
LTTALTGKGEILGTLQYMSPEQLQGKDVDTRSDLFSFGCVLYEMLAGKQAFEGQSAASVIAAILEREPVPLEEALPLDRVLRRCLAKDPDQRFQTARDLKAALTWANEQPGVRIVGKPNRMAWITTVAAIILLVALSGWTISHLRQGSADDPVIRFEISPPEGGRTTSGGRLGGPGFAVSSDGQTVAFTGVVKGKVGLWVRPLDAHECPPFARNGRCDRAVLVLRQQIHCFLREWPVATGRPVGRNAIENLRHLWRILRRVMVPRRADLVCDPRRWHFPGVGLWWYSIPAHDLGSLAWRGQS